MSPTNAFTRRVHRAMAALRCKVGEVAAPVYALAQCYGVRIEKIRKYGILGDGWHVGPAAGAVHLGKRTLGVEDPPRMWRASERAVYLHELTHVLFAHPQLGMYTPEDMIQLQAEHRLALAVGLRGDWAVDAFQLAGPLEWNMGGVDADEAYETAGQMRASAGWRAGLRRAQRLGVLDEHLLPTGRPADWKNLSTDELARLRAHANMLVKSKSISQPLDTLESSA